MRKQTAQRPARVKDWPVVVVLAHGHPYEGQEGRCINPDADFADVVMADGYVAILSRSEIGLPQPPLFDAPAEEAAVNG